MDGEITDDGYLVGQYVATNPHDQGKGTFFLYIRKNRHLNGIWAGYEDERGEINHGEYVFRPFLDVTIRDVSAEKRPAPVGLLESTDCDADVLEMVVNTEDRSGFTLTARTTSDTSLVARARRVLSPALEAAGVVDSSHLSRERSDAQFVGAVVASVRSAEELGSVLVSDRGLPTAVSCAEAVGVIDHVAVAERYRGRGVGTRLVEAAIERFERDGIDVVCIVGDENQSEAIGGIMDTLDFDKRQLVETVHDGATVSKSAQQVLYVKYNR